MTIFEILEYGFGLQVPVGNTQVKPTIRVKGSTGALNLILNEFILRVIYANLKILDNFKMDTKIRNRISGEIKKNQFNVIGESDQASST